MVAEMAVPYFARLVCLVLAAFFLVHTGLAAMIATISRRAVTRAFAMTPRSGAAMLLVLRLLPGGAALLFGCICLPSYLLYEPEAASERLGWACLMAAFAGAALCAAGVARGCIAAIRSARFLCYCRRENAPVFLLAGIVRRRVTVTPSMRKALTAAEFDAALRHEQAHGRSWDNLKRLAILASPSAFPFRRQIALLDAGWRRLSEFAADDDAVAGSPDRALALASALVRAGRMGSRIRPMTLATPLLAGSDELADRVQRLLDPLPAETRPRSLRVGWVAVAATGMVAFSFPVLPAVHGFLEALAH
jgi:hypothetical protein